MSSLEDSKALDDLRSSFGVDVGILAKYYPIAEVGLRAFDNNKTAILQLIQEEPAEPQFCEEPTCTRKVLSPYIYCDKHQDKSSTPLIKTQSKKGETE